MGERTLHRDAQAAARRPAMAMVECTCGTCGAALRVPAKLLGQQGRCNVCGCTVVAEPSAMGPASLAPVAGREQTVGRSAPTSPWGWRLLLAAAIFPPVFLVAITLWAGLGEDLYAQRISILNQVFTALYAYCVLAGGFKPHVLGRLVGLELDRGQVLKLFVPGLAVATLLAVITFQT